MPRKRDPRDFSLIVMAGLVPAIHVFGNRATKMRTPATSAGEATTPPINVTRMERLVIRRVFVADYSRISQCFIRATFQILRTSILALRAAAITASSAVTSGALSRSARAR